MEQLIPQLSGRVTEQEYLRLEEAAKTKHEFRNGRIIDMAGGTADHALIAMNIGIALGRRLKDQACKVYGSDLRVRIDESGNYCYPDLTIVCGPVEFAWPDRQTTITNPRVVIEVTSPSSDLDDHTEKFNDYRSLPSLAEYVVVAQDRRQVETFYRQDNGVWAIGPTFTKPHEAVIFRSLAIEVPLSEVYAGIEIPAPPDQAVPSKQP
jgi:Uma2 family endonuclease